MVATKHPARLWAAAGVSVAALGGVVLAATASTQGRSAVLAQLERPAAFSAQSSARPAHASAYPAVTVGPGRAQARVSAGAYRLALSLAPNRASARDGVTIKLTRAGRAVGGAKIALSYSMPSMGMPHVLASTLRERTGGSYDSLDPELAMPGTWQLRFVVTAPGAAPFTVIVDDHMRR